MQQSVDKIKLTNENFVERWRDCEEFQCRVKRLKTESCDSKVPLLVTLITFECYIYSILFCKDIFVYFNVLMYFFIFN